MYSAIGVGKLSETQKSKLRNGHPVRIKKGSGNSLHLTDAQIKKLESGKGLINIGEPKVIELRQWWKTKKEENI